MCTFTKILSYEKLNNFVLLLHSRTEYFPLLTPLATLARVVGLENFDIVFIIFGEGCYDTVN